MQSIPTTALASPASYSDLGDERAVLAGAQLVLLQLPPFISRTGQDRPAKPARSGDATRARRWPMSTETLMRRLAGRSLLNSGGRSVRRSGGVWASMASPLGSSRGSSWRVRACSRWCPTTTTSRGISTCGRCRIPNGNHDRHGSLDAGIEERDQPITCDGDGGHVGRSRPRGGGREDGSGVRPPVGAAALEPRPAFRAIRASRSIPASLVPSAPREAPVPQYAAPD
jgi:hypothetical protein